MAKLKLLNVAQLTTGWILGGTDQPAPINLSETLDFQNDEYLKRGGVAIDYAGARADGADTVPVAGFLDPQVIVKLNDIEKDFPVAGQEVPLLEKMQGQVDVDGNAGDPVYLDDDGDFNTVAGTNSKLVGRYINYDPKRTRGIKIANRTVRFDINIK